MYMDSFFDKLSKMINRNFILRKFYFVILIFLPTVISTFVFLEVNVWLVFVLTAKHDNTRSHIYPIVL